MNKVLILLVTTGMILCPCFSKFLASTTIVLESLPEVINPGQVTILGELCTLPGILRENVNHAWSRTFRGENVTHAGSRMTLRCLDFG